MAVTTSLFASSTYGAPFLGKGTGPDATGEPKTAQTFDPAPFSLLTGAMEMEADTDVLQTETASQSTISEFSLNDGAIGQLIGQLPNHISTDPSALEQDPLDQNQTAPEIDTLWSTPVLTESSPIAIKASAIWGKVATANPDDQTALPTAFKQPDTQQTEISMDVGIDISDIESSTTATDTLYLHLTLQETPRGEVTDTLTVLPGLANRSPQSSLLQPPYLAKVQTQDPRPDPMTSERQTQQTAQASTTVLLLQNLKATMADSEALQVLPNTASKAAPFQIDLPPISATPLLAGNPASEPSNRQYPGVETIIPASTRLPMLGEPGSIDLPISSAALPLSLVQAQTPTASVEALDAIIGKHATVPEMLTGQNTPEAQADARLKVAIAEILTGRRTGPVNTELNGASDPVAAITNTRPSPSGPILNTAPTQTERPTPPPPPAQQLTMKIGRAIVDGNTRMTVRLDPPDLGRVAVRLEFQSEGAVRAMIAADKPETLELLQRDARFLERALNDAGVRTDSNSLNFTLSQNGQGQGQGQSGDQKASMDFADVLENPDAFDTAAEDEADLVMDLDEFLPNGLTGGLNILV